MPQGNVLRRLTVPVQNPEKFSLQWQETDKNSSASAEMFDSIIKMAAD